MSFMGMQYTYCLASRYPTEAEAVIFAYTQAGWNYITHEWEGAVPKRLIFEWPHETHPCYPDVNWTLDQR